jgi:hypothetical protein
LPCAAHSGKDKYSFWSQASNLAGLKCILK